MKQYLWTNNITNTHFNEALTYSYNGNISSMQWGQAGKTRKYNFTYDNLSRLKAAAYRGDGNFNTGYSYDKHGNMLTLQRYGLSAAATYGIIDNLTMTYAGNQMKTVSDAAADIALNTSMDFKDYSNVATEYTYNRNGAMSQDLNKGISSISYNVLNLPRIVDIKNKTTEGRNEYTYSASGQKLKAVQRWNPNYSTTPVIGSTINTAALTQSQTTDYVGNVIYENNTLKRILVDGGYYESGNYYFYINDHLGNNRVVADAAASVVQSTQYYPFGSSFADAITTSTQPYKYNGKELDARNGLNMYDYSARWKADWYFTTVDPLAEKYYSISPYAYVANNPLKYIDPDGKDIIILRNSSGARGTGHAAVLVGNNDKGWTYISKDGYTGSAFGSQSKYVVESFNTLDDFKQSPHNFELKSGTHSTTDGKSAGSFDFKTDSDGNKIQRYDKALLIETTQKDGSSTDSKTIEAATNSAKSTYSLTNSDCSHVVSAGLSVSQDKSGHKVKSGETPNAGPLRHVPNGKFNRIEERNPDSKRIDEELKSQ